MNAGEAISVAALPMTEDSRWPALPCPVPIHITFPLPGFAPLCHVGAEGWQLLPNWPLPCAASAARVSRIGPSICHAPPFWVWFLFFL